MQRPGRGSKKVYILDPGHVTKVATMFIYGKNLLKNRPVHNHLADCLETWYVAFGELVPKILYKW